MPTLNAQPIFENQLISAYNPNLLPEFMMFDDPFTWTVLDGGGAAVNNSGFVYYGSRSLRFTSPVTDGTTIDSGGTQTLVTIPATSQYILSFRCLESDQGITNATQVTVKVFINGVSTDVVFFTATTVDGVNTPEKEVWHTYYAVFDLTVGDEIQFGFAIATSDVGTSYRLYFDGFKLERAVNGGGAPTIFSPTHQFIKSGSATLNFPSTLSGANSDLTMTVYDASEGDVVSLGVTSASMAYGTFFGFVSAPDTVTVRYTNTQGSTQDPASATFKVKVFK